jgi:hypothetical protein
VKLVFIDETENSTHVPGFYAVCAVAIDATKYKTVRQEIDKALDACKWLRSHEFKGSCMFSASKGDANVAVERRIDAVNRMVAATVSKANARAVPVIAWTDGGPSTENHLALVKQAIAGALKQKPTGKTKGKDLCFVFADGKDSIHFADLSDAVREAVQSRGYFMGEDVIVVSSSCASPGVLLADVLAYLGMWIYADRRLGAAQPTLFDDQEVPLSAAVITKIVAVQAVLETGSELRFCPTLPIKETAAVKSLHKPLDCEPASRL